MVDVTGLSNLSALQTQNNMKKHTTSAADAIAQLSSGTKLIKASSDSSAAAISKAMTSDISVLNQTKINASNASSLIQVAASAMNDQLSLLTSLKTLATKAADASLSPTNRGLVNNEYQEILKQNGDVADRARWNGVSLMTGGAGTVTLSGVVAQATGNVAAPALANTMAGTVNAATTGFIDGTATDVVVNIASANSYDVSIKVGEQWFTAEGVVPAAGGILTLTSTADSANRIALDFAANVGGIASAATFQQGLEETLGIPSGRLNATFLSQSTAANNGLTGVTAASSAPTGTYSIRYDANSNLVTLTNGEQKWTQSIATTGAEQTISFANGVSATFDNTFAVGTSVTPMTFDVARSATNQVSLTFQLAEKATDTLTVNIAGTTNQALGINGTSVDTIQNANTASDALKVAIDRVNSAFSQIGAQQKRLESTQNNLTNTVTNLEAARANVADADIAASMTNFTISNTMAQVSNVALSQSLGLTQQLLSIVRT